MKDHPLVAWGRRELADTYHGLGIVLVELGEEKKGEDAFGQALALRKKLADDFPSVLQYSRELAYGYYDLCFLLWRQKKLADAETAGGQALELRKQLVARAGPIARYRRELARSYHDQGNLLRVMGRLAEAKSAWLAALPLREQLVAQFPRVADYHNELAGTLGNLANLHNVDKEFEAALPLLEQARVHLSAALEISPKNPAYRLTYRNNRQALAQSHLGLADHAGLAAAADELACSGNDPASDSYLAACCHCRPAQTLADKDGRLTAGRRRQLARVYSDRALALLRQAIKSGFRDAEQLKHNPDFAQLRTAPEFEELLAALGRDL